MSATDHVDCSRSACGRSLPVDEMGYYNGHPFCSKACSNLSGAPAGTELRYPVPLQEKTP